VTVIDVSGGPTRSDATVVVRGNRIASIGAADSLSTPADAQVVDGRGKFLIPGLWDMHVHAAWPNIADAVGELFVANGVTGVRDMWGDPGIIRDWRARVTDRDGRRPRIVASGNLVVEPELMREVERTIASRGWAAATALERGAGALIDSTYDAARCRSLAERFVRNETWQVPTLTVRYNMTHLDDPALESDPRLRFVPHFVRQRWYDRAEAIDRGTARAAAQQAQYRREVAIVGQLFRAGVPILAGTDELNPYCLPGFSLHDELVRLVDAGLTPLGALQAATLNPARFLHATDSLGSVTAGKVADLVLLDADP